MKGYKLKAYLKTPKGKAISGLVGAAVIGTAAVMYPLFGTDQLVDIDDWVFKNNKSKYSQESVMANVKLYKDGVFVPEEKEEGTDGSGGSGGDSGSGGGDSGSQSFDPSTVGVSTESITTVPTVTTGSGKVAKTLSHGLKLYDGPTKTGEGYEVLKPSSYRAGSWLMCEPPEHNPLALNKWAVGCCKDQVSTAVDGAGYVNSEGRSRVAVGPAVTKKDFQCNNSMVGLGTDVYANPVFDVVIADKSGTEYYWPLCSGCCKAHTYSTGVVQTGKHVYAGGTWELGGGAAFDDSSVVECVGRYSPDLVKELQEFEFVKFVVYYNQ